MGSHGDGFSRRVQFCGVVDQDGFVVCRSVRLPALAPLIPAHSPPRSQSGFALAKQRAGIQGPITISHVALGPRFRGDERSMVYPSPLFPPNTGLRFSTKARTASM